MAFFGVTALGPQNPFAAEHKHAHTLDLFNDEDLISAFESTVSTSATAAAGAGGAGAATVTVDDLPTLLRHLYHGPPPSYEVDRVVGYCTAQAATAPLEPMTLEVWLAAAHELQRAAVSLKEGDRATAAHFNSFDMLREQRDRHVRRDVAPTDTFAHPLTLTQEVGWRAREEPIGFARHPKNHCAETKFMSALHASGYI